MKCVAEDIEKKNLELNIDNGSVCNEIMDIFNELVEENDDDEKISDLISDLFECISDKSNYTLTSLNVEILIELFCNNQMGYGNRCVISSIFEELVKNDSSYCDMFLSLNIYDRVQEYFPFCGILNWLQYLIVNNISFANTLVERGCIETLIDYYKKKVTDFENDSDLSYVDFQDDFTDDEFRSRILQTILAFSSFPIFEKRILPIISIMFERNISQTTCNSERENIFRAWVRMFKSSELLRSNLLKYNTKNTFFLLEHHVEPSILDEVIKLLGNYFLLGVIVDLDEIFSYITILLEQVHNTGDIYIKNNVFQCFIKGITKYGADFVNLLLLNNVMETIFSVINGIEPFSNKVNAYILILSIFIHCNNETKMNFLTDDFLRVLEQIIEFGNKFYEINSNAILMTLLSLKNIYSATKNSALENFFLLSNLEEYLIEVKNCNTKEIESFAEELIEFVRSLS